MMKGTGYAGEGDVLTASLVGALGSTLGETTFTEMFCPDWSRGRVFLSHMGETNLELCAGKPKLMVKPFPWSDAEEPAVAVGRLKGGKAVLVNLAPGPGGSYRLILAEVDMLDVAGEDLLEGSVRGWFRPPVSLEEFLERYSRAGGTHHCALVYGDVTREIEGFGKLMNWQVRVIRNE